MLFGFISKPGKFSFHGLWSRTLNGVAKTAFASIWHPNGLHEMIPVGPKSRGWDITTSQTTGNKYFNSFFLDLLARNASFTFHKWVRQAELIPILPEQLNVHINISESYGEGTAQWNGKNIRIQGHIEQLSVLK
ncbi:hypothetical protein BKA64DRAFT_728495 [Cadophora sp. MPI-SDFR-AT-0126]|nr:hypothetical protein BKA64DRAFT_728495 [Leotiomycetes sp. MPI-SDFR-AT-0126]